VALDGREVFDISPRVCERLAVFPGDTPYTRHVSLDCTQGAHLTLSSITTTLHIGAHADAPNHYHAGGKGIAARDLGFYLGACQVVQVSLPKGERILPHHINISAVQAKRVLFKTDSFGDPNQTPECFERLFNSLSPELIDTLARRGVVLFGIDTPSVDPFDSKLLESHQALARHDVAVLEGLVLTQVPEGFYDLIALPLRLVDADASPVRAVLLR
jgi:arylformamidase